MNIRQSLIWAGAGGVVLLLGVSALYFFVLRTDPPPPVNLNDALASVAESDQRPSDGLVSSSSGGQGAATDGLGDSDAEVSDGQSADPDQDPAPSADEPASSDGSGSDPAPIPTTQPTATATATASPSPSPSAPSLVGGWHISSQGDSFVGYRVREELARVGFQTAVGRTTAVTGRLTYDGQSITAVAIEADLSQLVSDDARRENHLRGSSLETERYPTATFTLAQPIAVGSDIVEGVSLSVTAVGDLTIHGITRRVAIPLQGQLSGGLVIVVGSLEIQFADYNIETPDSGLVLSVEDHGIMELQLIFEHD